MKVCVFGAGNMGARITEVFLTNGHDVTMLDVKQEFIDRGVKTITNDLAFLVKKEKMTEEHKNELLASLKTSLDRKAAADADFVMEVILERMDLKKDLLQELEEDYARLEALIACINRTNCCTLVDGVPLSDLLARRDCRQGTLGILRNFLDNASELVSRRTVGEIRIRSTVDVRSMQREVDRMSKELRELDEKIQEAIWTTDLLFLEEK